MVFQTTSQVWKSWGFLCQGLLRVSLLLWPPILWSFFGKKQKNRCFNIVFFSTRTRLAMQKDNFSYKNIMNAIKIISEKEGYISFYSGLTITIMVNAHFFFLLKKSLNLFYFVFYRATSRESFHITALDSFHIKFSKGN